MGEPCDICGVVGFGENIVKCTKCCIAREHVYCMQVHRVVVPNDWICEMCKLGNCDGCEEVVADSCGGIQNDPVLVANPSKVCVDNGRQVHGKWKRSVDTGKVKYLPVEEVIKMSSQVLAKESPSASKIESKTRSAYSMRYFSWNSPFGCKRSSPKIKYMNLEPNPSSFHPRVTRPPQLADFQINSKVSQGAAAQTLKELKGESPYRVAMKEHGCKEQVVGALTSTTKFKTSSTKKDALKSCAPQLSMLSPPIVSSGGNFYISGELRNVDNKERDLLNLQPKLRLYRPYLPALHFTWKGGFKFLDTVMPGEFYGGFQAQTPCRVHRKAYEFSKTMPIVLQVHLLPRGHLTPDIFQIDPPKLNDIALYFSPADNIERSKENHDCLFNLMDTQNSVMRSHIDGVELLIFTSKLLHEDSQGVIRLANTDYFLWGVFLPDKKSQFSSKVKGKLPQLLSPNECACADPSSMDNREVIDMVIDMIGGKMVGNVEVCVPGVASKGSSGRSDVTGRTRMRKF